MNDTPPLSDDPRLTAYALGELEGDERAAVEAALQSDPAARAALDQIRAAATELEAAFVAELHAPVAAAAPQYAPPRARRGWAKVVRFPQFYFVISGAAAAAFAMMVIWRQPEFEAKARADALHWQRAQDQRMQARESARRSAAAEKLTLTAVGAGDAAPATDLSATLARDGFTSPAAPMLATAASPGVPVAAPRMDVQVRTDSTTTADRAGPAQRRTTRPRTGSNENQFLPARGEPVSSFSAEVGARSYGDLRQALRSGKLPPSGSVRIEEWVNYFPYRYDRPAAAGSAPMAAAIEVAEAPWAPGHRLVRIGLQARELPPPTRLPASLVFLLDVSDSMREAGKLPLLQASLRRLVAKLHPKDRLAIVTYGGRGGVALASTAAAERAKIEAAIDGLAPAAASAGSGGIELAYQLAGAQVQPGGVNRVVLCTDGNFNLGLSDSAALARLVSAQARAGIGLSVLGVGRGGERDAAGEALAARGSGAHAYVESLGEADRLLSEQVEGAIAAVARDVLLEVEFNPATVASYRLIGYESPSDQPADRAPASAGPDLRAGASVTALYEVVPASAAEAKSAAPAPDLKYQARPSPPEVPAAVAGELLTVKVKYRDPAGENRKVEFPVTDGGAGFAQATPDFKFAAAVAQFGMQLRHSPYRGTAGLGDVLEWASAGLGTAADDPAGLKGEFVGMVRRTQAIWR